MRDPGPGRLGDEDFLAFNEALRGAILVGAPLPEGLETLSRELPGRQAASAAVAGDLRRGLTLSEALAKQGNAFPAVYVRLVQAGERAGSLHAVLQRVTGFGREMTRLRAELRESLVYPIFLYAMACLVLALWGGFFAPTLGREFGGLLRDLGVEGPMPRATVAGLWILGHGPWFVWMSAALLCLLLGAIWTGSGLARGRSGAGVERLLMRVPALGALLRAMAASRFCHTASLLVERGVPAPEAIPLAAEASGSAWVSADAAAARRASEGGASFGDAVAHLEGLPGVVSWLVRHGESRRELPQALEQLGQFYLDATVRRARLMRSLAPTFLVLAVGLFVVGTAVTLFLPLVSMMSGISAW